MSAPKNGAAAAAHACTITVPYGHLQIVKGGVTDHANMRVDQLTAFLLLISGEGHFNFAALQDNDQNSLLWMAHTMAQEVRELLPLMVEKKSEVQS